MIPAGTYSRLAIGLIILTHVIAYNETGATTVLFSAFIAAISGACSGKVTFHCWIYIKSPAGDCFTKVFTNSTAAENLLNDNVENVWLCCVDLHNCNHLMFTMTPTSSSGNPQFTNFSSKLKGHILVNFGKRFSRKPKAVKPQIVIRWHCVKINKSEWYDMKSKQMYICPMYSNRRFTINRIFRVCTLRWIAKHQSR